MGALDVDAEAEPPDGEFAEAIKRVGRGKGHAVVGANGVGKAKFLKGALEGGDGEFFLRCAQRLTGEEVAARKVGDGQQVAVAAIAEHELAFVVGAPERVGFGRLRQLGAAGGVTPPAATFDEAVAVEDGMDGTDGGQVRSPRLLAEFLADLRCAPGGILALQADDGRLDRGRQGFAWRKGRRLRPISASSPQPL